MAKKKVVRSTRNRSGESKHCAFSELRTFANQECCKLFQEHAMCFESKYERGMHAFEYKVAFDYHGSSPAKVERVRITLWEDGTISKDILDRKFIYGESPDIFDAFCELKLSLP